MHATLLEVLKCEQACPKPPRGMARIAPKVGLGFALFPSSTSVLSFLSRKGAFNMQVTEHRTQNVAVGRESATVC